MNTHVLIITFFALLVAGCKSHFSETVCIRAANGKQTLPLTANIQIEIEALREIVPSFVSVDWGYDIKHIEGTGVLCLTVTTENREKSEMACKQIAQKYIRLRGGALVNVCTTGAVQRAMPCRFRLELRESHLEQP